MRSKYRVLRNWCPLLLPAIFFVDCYEQKNDFSYLLENLNTATIRKITSDFVPSQIFLMSQILVLTDRRYSTKFLLVHRGELHSDQALVCQADGRVFESNQWLSFDFQILSYLLRFKIRVSTLCASFRTSHSWAYSPVTAVWSPSGQLAGCGLDYGCGRRRTMSIPVRLRAAILGAKRSYSCSSDCLVLRLCQLLSSIYD